MTPQVGETWMTEKAGVVSALLAMLILSGCVTEPSKPSRCDSAPDSLLVGGGLADSGRVVVNPCEVSND